MSDTKPVLLRVDASMREEDSVTRQLSDRLVDLLKSRMDNLQVNRLDLAETSVPLIDEAWIGANFTDPADRTDAQRDRLAGSDALVAGLKAADILVIAVPIYNFGVPAALKAWIDQIARARETFRYTENGPVGLLEGKKAYLVIASGGTPVDSPIDFATPYMRHVMKFVGIDDVTVVAAEQLMARGEEAIDAALAEIEAVPQAA